jgi:hypothetical protein
MKSSLCLNNQKDFILKESGIIPADHELLAFAQNQGNPAPENLKRGQENYSKRPFRN